VFTFGREHEKECAVRHVRDSSQVGLVLSVIDSVHDLLEGKVGEERVQSSLRAAFVEGGSGVWEQAGAWLRKLCMEYPKCHGLWEEFATHPRAEIRFRAAAYLDQMPKAVAENVQARLANDKSARVREMAIGRLTDV
jgi:hypothetical protein